MDNIRNEIKSYIAKSGMTLTEIVNIYNETHEPKTTTQNISNKLTRGTIKYSECVDLAQIMGYTIKWEK
ncbi:MAG: LLM class flavin-dependent oxidoreductase [Eubacteriales bacterium]|nr:LLM class flavin-dependent oxidoreductase [Eubacteriales bacterium]